MAKRTQWTCDGPECGERADAGRAADTLGWMVAKVTTFGDAGRTQDVELQLCPGCAKPIKELLPR